LTPQRSATVIHGSGENCDAFADVVIVGNYDVLTVILALGNNWLPKGMKSS
jgi:hypothetical protein